MHQPALVGSTANSYSGTSGIAGNTSGKLKQVVLPVLIVVTHCGGVLMALVTKGDSILAFHFIIGSIQH